MFAFNGHGERSLTKFQRLQRAIATSRGHPTNATLEQSVTCCCIVTGQRNCAITVTNGFSSWVISVRRLPCSSFCMHNVLGFEDNMKQISFISLMFILYLSNKLKTQIMTQDLLLSTDSRTSQGHAISSRDSALGGSMMTDGFPGN